jgi:hypothetical protein
MPTSSDNETIVVSERAFEQNLVPDVVGMGLMDALVCAGECRDEGSL